MSDILERPPVDFDRLIKYGKGPQHFAEFRLPRGVGPFPFLLVVHGGFWSNKYDLKHIGHLCAALAGRGVATCSIEYRRVGDPGGGWPGTFQDGALAADRIMEEISLDSRIDTTRTGVIGHSAGGHLALWLVSRHRVPETSAIHHSGKNQLTTAISLAGVCDLKAAWREGLGSGAAGRLLGGSPEQHPDRYSDGSPIELLPSGAKALLVHGSIDKVVPVSQSERFAQESERLGEHPSLIKLEGVGHFELIDPKSRAWTSVEESVLSILGIRRSH